MINFFKRWFFLLLLVLSLAIFLHFNLQHYLTFMQIKQHRAILLAWTQQHYFLSVAIYMLVYISAIALSFPGAVFLTLIGGFLFGPYFGTLYVIFSATIGAACIFFAVRFAFEPFFRKRTAKWIEKLRIGFQKNSVQYLLFLRLMPIFPFWIINIAAALLGVRTSIFLLTTFFGIIPATFIYTLLGNGLGEIFDKNQKFNLLIIYEPHFIIPLLALAILSILVFSYKKFKKK